MGEDSLRARTSSVSRGGDQDDSYRGRGAASEFEFNGPRDEGVEGSAWKQIKRAAIETIFGKGKADFTRESSGSYIGGSFIGGTLGPGGSWHGGGGRGRVGSQSQSGVSSNTRLLRSEALVMQRNQQQTSPYIISPGNPYLLIWEQVIILFAAYSAVITPFEFAFFNVPPAGLRIFDNVINLFFLAEMVLTFFIAYKNKKTYLFVTDHQTIALRYLSSWFLSDLLGIIPWDLCYIAAGANFDNWSQIFRWLTLVRVLRTRFVTRFFKKLQRDIRLSYFVVRIIELLMVELYITHIAGCIFYFLALTYPPDEEGYTWIGSLTLGAQSYANFRDMPIYITYLTSLYWSVVTMGTIGYGDIHAVNWREMIFVMMYITFDLMLSAYLVGNITALVVKGSNTTLYRDKMAKLIKFMNRNHLPHVIRHQLRQHVRLHFETEQCEDEILEDFPVSLQHKVARALFRRVVEDCYLFEGCSSEFINQIVARAVREYFFPSEVIVLQRDAAEHMYIVCSGYLEEQGAGAGEHLAYTAATQDPTESTQLAKPPPASSTMLVNGMAFGELALLCNIPQPFTVVAKELSQVLRIDKDVLNSVIAMYIVDGRQIVENVLARTHEEGSKFAAFSSEIRSLISQQEAELTMSTIYAASRGDVEHLKDLIKAGANPSKADYDGRSPLHLAAGGGFDEVVRFLIMEGADVNGRDNFGTTPLLEALRAGQDATAKIILEKGGSVNLQEAGTDLCNAVINGDTGLLKRLLEHGVDPNSADYDLRTPLHIASAEGFLLVTRILVEHGADVMARDRWGNTALDEARRCGSLPLVRYLEESMGRKAAGLSVGDIGGLNTGDIPAMAASHGELESLEKEATADGASAGGEATGGAGGRAEDSQGAGVGPAATAATMAAVATAAAAAAALGTGAVAPSAPAAADHITIPIDGKPAPEAAAPMAPTASSLGGSGSGPTGGPTAGMTGVAAAPSSLEVTAAQGAERERVSRTPSEMSRPPSSFASPMASPGSRKAMGAPRGRGYQRPGQGYTGDTAFAVGLQGKKRVTLYPFPPWSTKQRRVGRVMWLPESLPELLEAARLAFGQPEFQHLLGADGGEITSLDLILDSDRLYLAKAKDMEEEAAQGDIE